MLFIPIGFIFYHLTASSRQTFFMGIMLMLCVEVIQGITGSGVFDIDDLFLNIFGIMIGAVSHMYFKKQGKIMSA